ncbi:AMP-binding protein [Rhodococcus sp. USK13]|uniref:AMP-binding protein n=1 Tax=Rhodococcus sp. USK13 TaxID=2806442 RepID=UPI002016AACE|nr:AMP-binding protein [Rhodococcus sp. USK13]
MSEVTDAVFPRDWAHRTALVVEPTGETVTFAELEERSNRAAHFFREQGLRIGDTVALLLENRIELLVLAFAAQRCGLYYAAVNTHLTPAEIDYIVDDCGASLVVSSSRCHLAVTEREIRRFSVDRVETEGWHLLDLSPYLVDPVVDQAEGDFLLYSSGTTGRPRGIERPLTGGEFGSYPDIPGKWLSRLLGLVPGDVFLTPAPLYHAAPLAWTMGALRQGATAVVMERFDAPLALELIERHRVTHSQWVPTMFVRMLKLDPEVRNRFDLTSHRVAVHAAAACPIEVKRQMIHWWGPILFEFYSSTEGVGATSIFSEDWLRKPGSVGRPLIGKIEILDDDHRPVNTGVVGTIWFSGGGNFRYHSDAAKTAEAHDAEGRATVGDLGWMDEDGYLFLADRRADLIISGGVNVYPREIEDALILHPDVLDIAVVGLPDEEMGHRVVAFVQLRPDSTVPVESLPLALTEFCSDSLAKFKIPREFRFVEELPRTPTGKLRKHELLPR